MGGPCPQSSPALSSVPGPCPGMPSPRAVVHESLPGLAGRRDVDLHRMEVHGHCLIQLESWFTATGQTRVTVVGPPQARQWLFLMVWNLQSGDSDRQAQGGCPWLTVVEGDGGAVWCLGFFQNHLGGWGSRCSLEPLRSWGPEPQLPSWDGAAGKAGRGNTPQHSLRCPGLPWGPVVDSASSGHSPQALRCCSTSGASR